jgi:alkylation response protein AidB-like acyl-CoA dehydrogenase
MSRFLEAVRSRRASFEAAAVPAEEARTLPDDMVKLMRELGLFWLKTPRELGGDELAPLEFCEVLEEIAYYDASVAWAAMVGNGTTGTVAGWLPDEGLREVFPADGTDLPICAGQFSARGKAVPVDGGYVVTGRWGFGSGINHSAWVVGGCVVDDGEAGGGAEIFAVAPKSEATLHDNWHVAGLQGTGSHDFSLTEVFVPAARVIDGLRAPGRRGGELFRPPPLMFVSNELNPACGRRHRPSRRRRHVRPGARGHTPGWWRVPRRAGRFPEGHRPCGVQATCGPGALQGRGGADLGGGADGIRPR